MPPLGTNVQNDIDNRTNEQNGIDNRIAIIDCGGCERLSINDGFACLLDTIHIPWVAQHFLGQKKKGIVSGRSLKMLYDMSAKA